MTQMKTLTHVCFTATLTQINKQTAGGTDRVVILRGQSLG